MPNLNEPFFLPNFSHIYVEQKIKDHPNTLRIIERFPQAQVVNINNYKEVFNRPKQDYIYQSKSRKLILAEKKPPFFYPGAEVCHDFGYTNFYYTSTILNCIYNCAYCYLKGMFETANLLFFVNIEDYFASLAKFISKEKIFLAVSYESDLLALEHIFPYTKHWLNFAKQHHHILIEIRTKSANYHLIKEIPPLDNVILAWSLTSHELHARYEDLTPNILARIKNIKEAVSAGWQVRLSFDPIIIYPDWVKGYQQLINYLFQEVPPAKIYDLSLGVFRMGKDYLKNMKKTSESDLIYYPFSLIDGVYTYEKEIEDKLLAQVTEMLLAHVPKEKIIVSKR